MQIEKQYHWFLGFMLQHDATSTKHQKALALKVWVIDEDRLEKSGIFRVEGFNLVLFVDISGYHLNSVAGKITNDI